MQTSFEGLTITYETWEYPARLIDYLHKVIRPFGRERLGEASRSEIKRWFDQGAVQLNGERVEWNHEPDYGEITSLILFPKGKRVTLV
jgi:hypothetical protein